MRSKVSDCLLVASQHYQQALATPEILFDLHARAAGQYRYRERQHQLRFNPYLFSSSFEENLNTTVPHEVAHYVAYRLFGRVRPHGDEWRAVMRLFGVAAEVTHQQDVNIPGLRSERRWSYQCACQLHSLTTRRHNRVLSGQGSYTCRSCGQLLHRVSSDDD